VFDTGSPKRVRDYHRLKALPVGSYSNDASQAGRREPKPILVEDLNMKRPILRFATVFFGIFAVWSSSDAQDAERLPGAKNAYPLRMSGFTVRPRPEWSLDLRGDLPAERLNIVGAALLRNGIVVAEGIAPRLLVYSADRRLVRAVPLKSASRNTVRIDHIQRVNGDTLAIIGDRAGWILNAHDTVAATFSFADYRPPPSRRMSIMLAVLSDGSSLWGVLDLARQGNPPAKRFTDSLDLFLQSPTRELRSIAQVPAMMLGTDSAGSARQMWFYPHFASGATQENFYYGFGGDYLITRLNPITGEEKSWRRAWTPRKVTKADIDEFIDGWSVSWNKGADSVAVKAAMRNAPFAEWVPAFSQFVVSTAGELWVRNANLIDAQGAGELNQVPLRASTWSVFDPEGQWLTDVTLPAGFQPTDIGSDYILGVQYGMANGLLKGREQSVVLYRYSR
jgi:hypothetical protein